MRIISGKLKGRKLKPWKKNLPLRPMTDQVKETLFNVLAPYFFEDCLFLDLFSGTGNLALEALSRGAGLAHAVEKHPGCIELIKKNSEMLKQQEFLIIHKKDVFAFLRQNKKDSRDKKKRPGPFHIITADPPFPLMAGDQIMKSLENSGLCKKGTVIALEVGFKEDLKSSYSDFYLFSKKDFNDKKVWFYEYQ